MAVKIPNFHEAIGPMVIGFGLCCVVFGILSQQTVTYYQRYFHDRLRYKFLVGTLWVNQFVYVCFVGNSVYHYTVSHYGEFLYLLTGRVVWTLLAQVAVATVASTLVKIAFMLRVWTFSKKNVWVTGIIAAMIVAQFCCAIAYTIRGFQIGTLLRAHELKGLATVSLAVGVATDFLIALALCYFLRKLRSGFKKSDSLINMLSIYAINTGMATGAISAATLAVYNIYPTALYFMGSYFVLGNFYAISFICTLNTRRVVGGQGTDNERTTGETNRSQTNAIYMVSNPSNHYQYPGKPRHGPGHGSIHDVTSRGTVQIGVKREVITDLERGPDIDVMMARNTLPQPLRSKPLPF